MKKCIVVDAYKFSKEIVRRFNQNGYQCIHVFSAPKRVAALQGSSTFSEHDYLMNIEFNGDWPGLLRQLKSHQLEFVVAGTEAGVEFADKLSHELDVSLNEYTLATARRNKYDMAVAIQKSQCAHAKFIKTKDMSTLEVWVNSVGYPVVLKPLESAGTDNIFICHNADELKSAFATIKGAQNLFGGVNSAVFCQEFMQGDEYMVNTVSVKGQHFISDIWRSTKRSVPGFGSIYDKEELVLKQDAVTQRISEYAKQVLDALGVKNGPAHSEIMFTDEGPKLIECGARPGGNIDCDLHTHAIGYHQLELMVDALTQGPEAVEEKLKRLSGARKHVVVSVLRSDKAGIVEEMPIIEQARQLNSYYKHKLCVSPGEYLVKTTNLINAPGEVYLVADDKHVLEQDYERLQACMAAGIITKKALQLKIAPEIIAAFPELSVRYVVADVSQISLGKLSEYVAPELIKAKAEASGARQGKLTQLKSISNWRTVYKQMGIRKNKYVSSIESLLKRVVAGKPFCTDIPAVDLYNACSIRNLLPFGAYDLDKVDQRVELRFGREGERFYPLGGDETLVDQKHVVYSDCNKVLTWLWNYRDAVGCALSEQTTTAIFFVDSAYSNEPVSTEQAAAELERVLSLANCHVLATGCLTAKESSQAVVLSERRISPELSRNNKSALFGSSVEQNKGDEAKVSDVVTLESQGMSQ